MSSVTLNCAIQVRRWCWIRESRKKSRFWVFIWLGDWVLWEKKLLLISLQGARSFSLTATERRVRYPDGWSLSVWSLPQGNQTHHEQLWECKVTCASSRTSQVLQLCVEYWALLSSSWCNVWHVVLIWETSLYGWQTWNLRRERVAFRTLQQLQDVPTPITPQHFLQR